VSEGMYSNGKSDYLSVSDVIDRTIPWIDSLESVQMSEREREE